MNQVTLDGRIITDIALRKTIQNETPVADFRIKNLERKDKNPLYIDIEVWGKEAENIANNGERGKYIVIFGKLRRDTWKTKDTGEDRSKIKITAHRVIIVDKIERTETSDGQAF